MSSISMPAAVGRFSCRELAYAQAGFDAHPQDQDAGYYSFPKQSELDAFAAAGGRLFDAAEITALKQY